MYSPAASLWQYNAGLIAYAITHGLDLEDDEANMKAIS